MALFVGAATVLLLADRSVSVVGSVRARVVRVGQAIEQTYHVNVVDRSDIPGTADQLGHAALWGTGMILFGWLLRSRLPIPLTALFVACMSVAFEVAQPSLSLTRRFESTDAVANMGGIAAAAILLAPVLWVVRRSSGMKSTRTSAFR
jgi:hypothetical protein